VGGGLEDKSNALYIMRGRFAPKRAASRSIMYGVLFLLGIIVAVSLYYRFFAATTEAATGYKQWMSDYEQYKMSHTPEKCQSDATYQQVWKNTNGQECKPTTCHLNNVTSTYINTNNTIYTNKNGKPCRYDAA
jgi:hypothetical protein